MSRLLFFGFRLLAAMLLLLLLDARPTHADLKPAEVVAIRGRSWARVNKQRLRRVCKFRLRQLRRARASFLNTDPTFRATHPMFHRLLEKNFYANEAYIAAMQRQANGLRRTRKIKRTKPIEQVDFIAFDVETTNNHFGAFDKKVGRFFYGAAEIIQFGYTIYKAGKVHKEGTINIKPSAVISQKTTRLTRLDEQALRSGIRFEDAAPEILKLLDGKVLIGHGAIRRDWSALQSNFARLGVTLPTPQRLIIDNHLLSANEVPAGLGLKKYAEAFDIKVNRHHQAQSDARVSGDSFFAAVKRHGIETLGEAFQLMRDGYDKRAAYHAGNQTQRQQEEQKKRVSDRTLPPNLGGRLLEHFGFERGPEFATFMGGVKAAVQAGALQSGRSAEYYVKAIEELARTDSLPPQIRIWPATKK